MATRAKQAVKSQAPFQPTEILRRGEFYQLADEGRPEVVPPSRQVLEYIVYRDEELLALATEPPYNHPRTPRMLPVKIRVFDVVNQAVVESSQAASLGDAVTWVEAQARKRGLLVAVEETTVGWEPVR